MRGVDIDAVHGERMDKFEQIDAAFEKWWTEHAYDGFGFATSKGVARSSWHAALRNTTPPYVPTPQFETAARLHHEAAARQFEAGLDNLGHYEAAWGRVFDAMAKGAIDVPPPAAPDAPATISLSPVKEKP